jgi:Fe-S oxidoreductase
MLTFTTVDRVLLTLLVAVVVAIFIKDLRAKIRHILAGPADRVRTDRIGRRLAVAAREVLLQTRVIGGRPIAGALHAAVFVGFIFFALETADHFLEPFGVPLLAPLLGSLLEPFKSFLGGVAILVSLAITGLAFRRFVMVKISPDPKSYSSGVVALMILVLMLTYLYGIGPEPRFEKANWWLHALLILSFPPLILRSKHFHILMAPVGIFFRTERLGELLPLDLDLEALEESEEEVALGLEEMAHVPWKMRLDFLTCVECRRCTEQCPANNCEQELDPRGFILAGRAALGTDGSVIGPVISETALGQCTTCGACESICPVGIEHLQVLTGAKRAQALATGKGMVAAEFLQAIERTGNPFSAPASARAQLIEELGIPLYRSGETEYLLWLGCVWAYNADARSSLAALIEVLDRAKVSYGVLESEACSGHHSRRQGEELQFQTLAAENIASLQEQGVGKLLTGCPHCFHTMRREYPAFDESFSVDTMHHSELLAQLLREGKLTPRSANANGRRLTFHDPCYLGRFEGVYDAPREVVSRAGFELIELSRRRERSFCCGGGGGGFTRTHEEEKRVDQERKREIAASGADVLVTGCPECKMMLDASVKETFDLAELVARTTGGETGELLTERPRTEEPRTEEPGAAPS